MKSCKLCWGIILVLLVVIGGGAYQFIIRGSTIESSDGRTAILLPAGERDYVLKEMREFLEGVQIITQAIAEDDMKTVVTAARKIGQEEMTPPPFSLMGKLPIEFKTLGLATHGEFDVLAKMAGDGSDSKAVLGKLSEIINSCTTCHEGYRIDEVKAGS